MVCGIDFSGQIINVSRLLKRQQQKNHHIICSKITLKASRIKKIFLNYKKVIVKAHKLNILNLCLI